MSMIPFYFHTVYPSTAGTFALVQLYSGRVDRITIVHHEAHLRGKTFNGRLLRTDNATEHDALYYYARAHMRGIECNDSESANWDWTERETYEGYVSDRYEWVEQAMKGL